MTKEKDRTHKVKPSGADVFASDVPVSDASGDRFKRWGFARRIAETISSRRDPGSLVVAIYGAWGEGKTTVLNFIETELGKHESIICVRFNPWRFSDEVHLLQNFFKTIADALGRSAVSYKEKIGKWFAHYASILAPISVSMPFLFEISPGEGMKNLAKALSSVELEDVRKRIESFLNEEKKRIVVLMDDIDRLDRAEIQNIFKLVKLSADFNHTAYVLAFDEEMVSAALGEKYGTGNKDAGRNFLEKIVQVPLYLPTADKVALRKFFFDCVDEVLAETQIRLSEDEAQAFVVHFVYGIEIKLQTPRIAKCYRNVLGFSMPILKGHVNLSDLMLIEGIRVFYPVLYDTVRDNAEIFLGSKLNLYLNYEQVIRAKTLEVINHGLEGLTSDECESAKYLLKILFPKLCGILDNFHYGSEWEEKWSRDRRICSQEHFSRYFTYTVAEDSVNDSEINALLDGAQPGGVEELTSALRKVLARKSAENLILKLMKKEKKIPEALNKDLAIAVSRLGGSFARPKTAFSFTTAFSQAGILIGQFVRNITSMKTRVETAAMVIAEADPLPFSLECFKWFKTTDEKGELNRIFSIEDEHELAELLLARIKREADKAPLYSRYPQDTPRLLEFWAHRESREETTRYITGTFKGNEKRLFEFLLCYIDQFCGGEEEQGMDAKPDAEPYKSIARALDAGAIYNALRHVYGVSLKSISNDSRQERAAYLFFNSYNAFNENKQI